MTSATVIAPLLRLAPLTSPDSGKCCCCPAAATAWYRSGIIADGRITVAALYCGSHDPDAGGNGQRLADLTVADVARLDRRRARRAAARVARLQSRAEAHGRAAAALRGASSHTHTHSLFAGAARQEAETMARLAALGRKEVTA